MKHLFLLLTTLLTSACFNKVEVPTQVETCIRDTKTNTCTNEMIVTHNIVIQLPVALVSDCLERHKDLPEPDKTIQTEACIATYIQSILDLIKGIKPEDMGPQQ